MMCVPFLMHIFFTFWPFTRKKNEVSFFCCMPLITSTREKNHFYSLFAFFDFIWAVCCCCTRMIIKTSWLDIFPHIWRKARASIIIDLNFVFFLHAQIFFAKKCFDLLILSYSLSRQLKEIIIMVMQVKL